MQKIYHIGNMDCANCAREVEEGVARLDGVAAVRVDFASAKMTLSGEVPFDVLQDRVRALGKTIQTEDAAPVIESYRSGLPGFWDYLIHRRESQLALAGGALILLALVLSFILDSPAFINGLYTVAMLTALYPIARNGINALVINRRFNINLLMTIAAIGAVVIGEFLEAAFVIFLFAIGESLEGFVTGRARDGLRGLIALKPRTALKRTASGEWIVSVDELSIGDEILVKPGEQIPMDGIVIGGESAVNQAPITGESVPVYKSDGAVVYAGCINGDGALNVRVTHHAADNTLSRVIQLVEEAQSAKSPTQRVIDRFAGWYTPAVVLLAALVAGAPPLLFGADSAVWLYRALTMLVIACPCALVISTPVSVISAITAAARNGILIKGGAHLEALGQVNIIAFDKTGTLTHGKPQVTRFHSLRCSTNDEDCTECVDVLALAAAVERHSAHPLAHAVTSAARVRQLEGVYSADGVQSLTGRGVRGVVDGRTVTVGSHALFEAECPHPDSICALVNEAEQSGQTALLLHDGDDVRGFFTVIDQPREDSRATIAELSALGIQTVMLTGDNPVVAAEIARQTGVDSFRASLLPEDKASAIQGLQADGSRAAMVGDGINDAPALARASVGVAMGGAGSAQALETADIALMQDDIGKLPYAVRLARFARHIIRANIVLTFVVKVIFLVLAAVGLTTMWVAIFADVGMTLLVTLNGMRPLRLGSK
ncbi:MAG: cadmium-translocating P-type ATPase [Anaerolineaceae bacterium]|nr:MAG: cadmium-translocating P-type ATPase [Anaerolineaceae bacterium]